MIEGGSRRSREELFEVLDERIARRQRAEALAREMGVDVGVAEGHLLMLTLTPSERLGLGLLRGGAR